MATEQFNILFRSSGARTVRREMKGISLGLAAVGFAALRMGREFVEVADTFTNLENRAKVFASSSADAEYRMESMTRIATDLNLGLDDVSAVYGQISIAQEAAGISTEKVTKIVENLSKATLLSGASSQAAAGALRQFSQGLAANRFSGQELNSVLEQTPLVAAILAESLGVATGELRRMGEQGLLTTDVLVKAFGSDIDSLEEKLANFAPPLTMMLTGLRNQFLLFFQVIDEEVGSAQGLKDFLSGLTDSLKEWQRQLRLGEGPAADFKNGLLQMIDVMKQLTPVFKGLAAGFIGSALVGWTKSLVGTLWNAVGAVQGFIGTLTGAGIKGASMAAAGGVKLLNLSMLTLSGTAKALNAVLRLTGIRFLAVQSGAAVAKGAVAAFSTFTKATGIASVASYTAALAKNAWQLGTGTLLATRIGVYAIDSWAFATKAAALVARGFGLAAKAAWATATLGLSVLITALPAIYFWLDENRQKMVELGGTTASIGEWMTYAKDVSVAALKAIWSAADVAFTFIYSASKQLGTAIVAAFRLGYDAVSTFAAYLRDVLPKAIEVVGSMLSGMWIGLTDGLATGITAAQGALSAFWSWVSSSGEVVWDTFLASADTLGQSLTEAIGLGEGAWDDFKESAVSIFQTIAKEIEKLKQSLTGFADDALKTGAALVQAFGASKNPLSREFLAEYDRAMADIEKTAQSGGEAAGQALSDGLAAAAGMAGETLSGVLDTVQGAVAPAVEGVTAAVDQVVDSSVAKVDVLTRKLKELRDITAAGPVAPDVFNQQDPSGIGIPALETQVEDFTRPSPLLPEQGTGVDLPPIPYPTADEVVEGMNPFKEAMTGVFSEVTGTISDAWTTMLNDQANASEQLADIMSSGLDSLTDNLVDYINTGKAGFKDMARDFLVQIQKMIVKQLMLNALQAIPGGGEGGGFFGSLFSANGGIVNAANGGTFKAGSPIVVGEKGPELFTPPSRGVITPNNRLGTQGGDGGNVTVVNVDDPDSIQDAMRGTSGEEIVLNHIRRNPDLIRGVS